jgi:hypothetical protein
MFSVFFYFHTSHEFAYYGPRECHRAGLAPHRVDRLLVCHGSQARVTVFRLAQLPPKPLGMQERRSRPIPDRFCCTCAAHAPAVETRSISYFSYNRFLEFHLTNGPEYGRLPAIGLLFRILTVIFYFS